MGILAHSSLLLLFISSIRCCGINLPYGNMTEDIDLEVDGNLKIQCSLFSSPIEYENITYEVSSKNLLLKYGIDFLENVTIIDNLTIEYSISNAQINDSGSYSCYLALPGLKINIFVCATYVAVGYKPLPVTNFSCISYEYTNLTCSWIKPFNPVRTDYTLNDLLIQKFKRRCPDKLNETSCRWTMDTRPQYYRNVNMLHFVLIGNNSLGKIEQNMTVDHYKIVRPGRLKNAMVTNVTETSMLLHWLRPEAMKYVSFEPGLVYSIQYQPILPPRPYAKMTTLETVEDKILIEDLVPHTEYEFKIRCRSGVAEREDMWSDPITLTQGTENDVPYLAPEITTSSFDIENILGNRTITLYWKAIPTEFENGPNFHYVIQYHIHHIPSRRIRSSHEVNVGNRTLYSFSHLDTHTAYMFKLYAVNSIGPSFNTSEIVVDKSEKLLERPKDIIVVSYGQGVYNLSWKASNQRPYNFTVYWCRSPNPHPYKCEGELEWLHTTKTRYSLQLPNKGSILQFAISANEDERTSGMSWASCIVYYKEVNYKAKRVEMSPKSATSLKIQWSLDCEAQKIVMKEYVIQYCEYDGLCSDIYSTKSCSDWKTVNVSNVSKDDFIISSLKPFTRYLAFIRMHTLSGWSGNSNLACQMTMPTAPDDPPNNVEVSSIDGKEITVSFRPPRIPNGNISRYIAYYNKSDGTSHHREFRVEEMTPKDGVFTINLADFMSYYTNYSIEIVACVDLACSIKSQPVYAFTEISYPEIINSPRIEIMDNVVNISWENPIVSNGPLDYFQVLKESNNSKVQIFNVTGQNYLLLTYNCSNSDEEKKVYHFRVRGVNIWNNFNLMGPYSQPTKTMLCSNETPIGVIVGIVVGSTVGAIVLTLILYSLYTWMKNQVEMIKGIQIQLPKELDSPMENLNSYDKFKNGLQTNHDSGIPCDTSYERLCAFASEDKDIGRVADENNDKIKRKSSGRNNSGESTASGKCHDSISSSNTTKTHLSIDSGAEIDSPPSPDGLFSDSSSTHTTPRSYKPDLTIVRENISSNSKDSGLDKEGACSFVSHNMDLPSKFSYFVKKKNFPYSNVQISNDNSRMPSYSKFAVLGAANVPSFIPYSEQSLRLLDNSLSNSEPSVADFDVGNGSEPLVPYCKFGLARSAGNGLNQPVIIDNKIGYSKFGTVYRALKQQDPILNGSSCPKFLPHDPETFTALTTGNGFQGKHFPAKDNDKAYSKFGVSCPKKIPVNGYVSYKDTLTYPSAENPGANHAYSKVGMTVSNGNTPLGNETGHLKENGIIINPAELPTFSSRNSYVPFRNAKGMNFNDSLCKASNSNDIFHREGNLQESLPESSYKNGILQESLPESSKGGSLQESSPESSYKNGCLLESPPESLCKDGNLLESFYNKNDRNKGSNTKNPETEQTSMANKKPFTDKDSNIDDLDCIIAIDSSPSLLDEITSDLGCKLKPTSFTISTNNDSKGFLIQDESASEPSSHLSNIMDALFNTYDFSFPENSGIEPICINLEDIDIVDSSTCDNDTSSAKDLTVDSRNFCKQCNNVETECSCSDVSKDSQVDVICNGHSSPLTSSDYVKIGCNSAC